jgi:hypothetical protein
MNESVKPPRPPVGLAVAGRALWRSLVAVYEFDPRELLVLRAAAAQADLVAQLEEVLASDGLVVPGSKGQLRLSAVAAELRQSRLALSRLLSDLAIPAASGQSLSPGSVRGRKAANSRWNRVRAETARRDAAAVARVAVEPDERRKRLGG